MAIRKNYTVKGNITLNDAYIKIGALIEENNKCNYTVYISKNRTESDNKNYADTIYGFGCPIEYNTVDFRKQCYDDLKSREQFIGAIDILEIGQTL